MLQIITLRHMNAISQDKYAKFVHSVTFFNI